jgi:hypothetical protein
MQLGMVRTMFWGSIHWVVRLPASNAAMGRFTGGVGAMVTCSVKVTVMNKRPKKWLKSSLVNALSFLSNESLVMLKL